jgi:hypothetical protein
MGQVLLAQLHHKLSRPEEESEDLLTSNVFGAFKYSGNLAVLGCFLAEACFRRTGSCLTIGESARVRVPLLALAEEQPDRRL